MLNAKITGMESLLRKSRRIKPNIERGKREFIQTHVKGEINIQGVLMRNIMRLVYDSYSPSTYKRTYNLMKSVRMEDTPNGVSLYMDGDFLEEASTVSRSWETGFAVEAKNVNYAWFVEEGHTYQNVAGHKRGLGKDFEMPPRKFMAHTFSHLIRNVEIEKIVAPLFRMWSL